VIVPLAWGTTAFALSEADNSEGLVESAQLDLFCRCGRRSVELGTRGCCRLCYGRRYRSLRFFGGLREVILKRDRFRCRACSTRARLVVHHRDGVNQRRRLITLCIGCHTRVHRFRALRSWVPEILLKLWRERHPREPVQLQLQFGIKRQVNRPAIIQRKLPDPREKEFSGRTIGWASLREPLGTGVGPDIESQPRAILSNWSQKLGARATVGIKASWPLEPEAQVQDVPVVGVEKAPPSCSTAIPAETEW
jgi:hypothetical protein